MDPIIKWPGGKSSEYEYISKFFPARFTRYVEPFFGGGAVFFRLRPSKAVINDVCQDLMDIYRYISNPLGRAIFADYLSAYASNWSKIPKYIKHFEDEIKNIFECYKQDQRVDLHDRVNTLIDGKIDEFNGLFSESFCLDRDNLKAQISRNLTSKLKRMAMLEARHGQLSWLDLDKNIETAFRSGFYMHFRDVLNYPDKFISGQHKRIANFYFIREFCYGSMFRFNREGKFNIPYGGIAYNSKDFEAKIRYATGDEVHRLLSTTEIFCDDFGKVISKINLSGDDFLFLDPPYDTDFKDYNDNSFDRKDQERLADCLYFTKAKFVLVIKNTSFINELYHGKRNIYIEKFDKSYQCNVKGRNSRNVEHLIIRNFQ